MQQLEAVSQRIRLRAVLPDKIDLKPHLIDLALSRREQAFICARKALGGPLRLSHLPGAGISEIESIRVEAPQEIVALLRFV